MPQHPDTPHEASPEHDAAREPRWTPGPYERDGLTVYTLQESGNRRVPMVNRWCAHVQTAPGTPEAELVAVAALFQAAPDMADALAGIEQTAREYVRNWPNSPTVRAPWEAVLAALAKARGEQG